MIDLLPQLAAAMAAQRKLRRIKTDQLVDSIRQLELLARQGRWIRAYWLHLKVCRQIPGAVAELKANRDRLRALLGIPDVPLCELAKRTCAYQELQANERLLASVEKYPWARE